MPEPSAIHELRERRRAERALELVRPDTRAMILAATESILADTPLHDISVARIMEEAQVSRGTFYSYFASKFEVVAALLEQVMEEMYDLLRPFTVEQPNRPREDAIREVLAESTSLWRRHRVVFRATHDHWHAVPELGAQWLRVVERFTDAIATELQREIDAGSAPVGIDTRQRAAAVLWATEHLLYVAGMGVDGDLPDEDAILEILMTMWTGTLYGPAPRGGSSDA
jgi:AcrR family transcriptional regulator